MGATLNEEVAAESNSIVIGYRMTGHDNNTYMYDEDDAEAMHCPVCGARLDPLAHKADYAFKKVFRPVYAEGRVVARPGAGLTSTYDEQDIVSDEFRAFCLEQSYPGLRFLEFNKDKRHFHFIVDREILIDVEQSHLSMLDLCPSCGIYRFIGGAHNKYFYVNQPLSDGIFRANLFFGTGLVRGQYVVVGVKTRAKILERGFKRIIFDPVYGIRL